MREIKFRYIYQHQETGRIMSKIYSLDDIEQGIVKQNQRGYWIVIARDQFTGLIDKHGTDIYEGDIVRYADTEYPDQSYTDIIVYDAPEFTCKSHGLCCPFESAEYEIIGNIYERGIRMKNTACHENCKQNLMKIGIIYNWRRVPSNNMLIEASSGRKRIQAKFVGNDFVAIQKYLVANFPEIIPKLYALNMKGEPE